MEQKRLVLVGVSSKEVQDFIRHYFEKNVDGSVVFFATDGTDLLIKASRTKPHLVIFSFDLPKTAAVDVFVHLKKSFPKDLISYLYLGPKLPKVMQDDHSVGNLVWFSSAGSSLELAIAEALNAVQGQDPHFKIRHLAPGQILMEEGEDPQFLYLVLKGSLRATSTRNNETVELGQIQSGEFVGEMAIISSEKRVATVLANEGCQLLEIPARDFNKVVLTKPSWSKALMSTLTRRLRFMNSSKSNSQND